MRFLLRSALALGVAGVLAACTDEPTSAPTAPVARAIPSVKSELNLTVPCDASVLKAYARIYAAKANDPLFAIIGDIPAAVKADGGTPGLAATDKAFDALAQVARIRGTGAQNTAATGVAFDQLVHGLLKCMASVVTDNALEPTTTGFQTALQPNWVFEVRGKSTDPAGGAYERGSTDGTWWAARPLTGAMWTDAISSDLKAGSPAKLLPDRVLIYGYRTTPASAAKLGSSFEHFSIPKITRTAPAFTIQATLGLCFADKSVLENTNPRVNHSTKFLTLTNPLDTECEPPPAFTGTFATSSTFNPLILAKRAAKFFAPEPLYAAAMFGGGSVTGTPDDWSPSAVWDLKQFELPPGPLPITDGRTSQQIHYGTDNTPVTFNVNIINGGGAAPDGTPVTVSVQGNQSVIAFFSDNGAKPAPTVTRFVKDGVVSFENVRLTKAGGYILEFRVSFDGFNGPVTSSASFNIQNK